MFTYIAEFEDDGEIKTREFGASLMKARGYARRLSAKRTDLIIYVVAIEERLHDCDRVGAEAYAFGRKDHADGRIEA